MFCQGGVEYGPVLLPSEGDLSVWASTSLLLIRGPNSVVHSSAALWHGSTPATAGGIRLHPGKPYRDMEKKGHIFQI